MLINFHSSAKNGLIFEANILNQECKRNDFIYRKPCHIMVLLVHDDGNGRFLRRTY